MLYTAVGSWTYTVISVRWLNLSTNRSLLTCIYAPLQIDCDPARYRQTDVPEHFYARKQNASRVFAIVWASVCPSVRHIRNLYQNGAS